MGCYKYQKYIDIYKQMEDGKWYTAKELGVAPATMTAMINRNLAERTDTSPRQYKKSDTAYARILAKVADNDIEFFGVYKKGEPLGMLCYLDNERIMDYEGKPYDVNGANKVRIGEKYFEI